MELLKKLYDENEILTNKLRAKIAELITKAQMNEEVVVIGTGNSCGCPCYKYNLNLIKTCPKCKGKVEEDFENGYTMVKKYNSRKEAYEEVINDSDDDRRKCGADECPDNSKTSSRGWWYWTIQVGSGGRCLVHWVYGLSSAEPERGGGTEGGTASDSVCQWCLF